MSNLTSHYKMKIFLSKDTRDLTKTQLA